MTAVVAQQLSAREGSTCRWPATAGDGAEGSSASRAVRQESRSRSANFDAERTERRNGSKERGAAVAAARLEEFLPFPTRGGDNGSSDWRGSGWC